AAGRLPTPNLRGNRQPFTIGADIPGCSGRLYAKPSLDVASSQFPSEVGAQFKIRKPLLLGLRHLRV
ncbi:MAG: hypothetical protein WCH44_12890, partial [Betaproteobacteria bacterium]